MNYEYWETLFYMIFPLCKDNDLDWWMATSDERHEEEYPLPEATIVSCQVQAVYIDNYNYNNEMNLVTI